MNSGDTILNACDRRAAINATNEITTLGTPNSSEPAAFIADTFDSSISSFWTQDTGTWTISSGKVKTTNQGAGILLASPDVYVARIPEFGQNSRIRGTPYSFRETAR